MCDVILRTCTRASAGCAIIPARNTRRVQRDWRRRNAKQVGYGAHGHPGVAVMTLALVTMRLLAAVPDPGHGEAPPGAEKFDKILKWVAWGGYAICVLGVITCAIGMVMEHRRGGGGGEAMGRLGSVMAACVLIGIAARLVTAVSA